MSQSRIFLQESSSSIKPVYQWTPKQPGVILSEFTEEIRTQGTAGVESIPSLTDFTIATKVKLLQSSGKTTTLMGAACTKGWALVMDGVAQELVFKIRLSEYEFRTGWFMPMETWVSLAVTFSSDKITLFVNSQIVNEIDVLGNSF